MELTKEYLIENGFETNHPDKVLNTWFKKNKVGEPEWRITVTQEYISLSNQLMFNVDCWKCGENGNIIKRSSVHMTNRIEELEAVIELCDITF